MKCLIVLVAALAVTFAQFGAPRRQVLRPLPPLRAATVARAAPPRASSADANANIVRYDSDISPDGAYSWAFETDNGIAAQEQGTPRNFGGNPPVVPVVAQGSFAYTSPEGQPISVSYVADENGFQPQGDSLPTPPPVPAQIARALEWLARNAPPQRKK
ncbi:larval cuticle protein LCP-22-like [Pectinophora gossypiella]|uniref:larval cuticle protein LCP-22-like n=1 Tax=Pectinophora gossypiella TaxID=13191 RepID=UPI00214DF4E7|nr:larval cuticle protein LCP-22-like [Pectinophora gossypiella]